MKSPQNEQRINMRTYPLSRPSYDPTPLYGVTLSCPSLSRAIVLYDKLPVSLNPICTSFPCPYYLQMRPCPVLFFWTPIITNRTQTSPNTVTTWFPSFFVSNCQDGSQPKLIATWQFIPSSNSCRSRFPLHYNGCHSWSHERSGYQHSHNVYNHFTVTETLQGQPAQDSMSNVVQA